MKIHSGRRRRIESAPAEFPTKMLKEAGNVHSFLDPRAYQGVIRRVLHGGIPIRKEPMQIPADKGTWAPQPEAIEVWPGATAKDIRRRWKRLPVWRCSRLSIEIDPGNELRRSIHPDRQRIKFLHLDKVARSPTKIQIQVLREEPKPQN